MRVYIGADEWYPVYCAKKATSNDPFTFEVSKKTLKRWEKVTAEFQEIQSEMGALNEKEIALYLIERKRLEKEKAEAEVIVIEGIDV